MQHPFAGSCASVQQAKIRFNELLRHIRDYAATNPQEGFIEPDPSDPTKEVHGIRQRMLPRSVHHIVFEVMQHLRSALDSTGYVVANKAGTYSLRAMFPFGNTPEEVQERHEKGRSSSDIPRPIFDVMAAQRPHLGGNHALVAVQKITNPGKHEFVVQAVPAVHSMHMVRGGFSYVDQLILPPVWDSTKKQSVWLRCPAGAETEYECEFRFHVTIDQIEGLGCFNVPSLLADAIASTRRALRAVWGECRRTAMFT